MDGPAAMTTSPLETDKLVDVFAESTDAQAAGCCSGVRKFEEAPQARVLFRKTRRKRTAGLALLGLVVAVLVWKRAGDPCSYVPTGGVEDDYLVSLALGDQEGLLQLPRAGGGAGTDAVAQWLAASSAAGDVAGSAVVESAEIRAAAEQAVRQAMGTGDRQQAERVVKRALGRAVGRWRAKRRKLKRFVGGHSRGFHSLRLPGQLAPAQKASVASCVFDVLQATTQLAALAANIKDASETCANDRSAANRSEHTGLAGRACALNVESVLYSVAAIASALSVAASNCADTLTPNLNALCAGSITSIIQTLLQVAVSSELIASACAPGAQDGKRPGEAASNIGSVHDRRLEARGAEGTAQGRRLLFGGGIASDATSCFVDVNSAAWFLAEAALAINSAANANAGASCASRDFAGGAAQELKQGFCAVDVAGAIYGFLQATYFILFSVAHCTDDLQTQALCGAGIDGVLSSLAAVVYAGSAMWLSCEELQEKWPRPPLAQGPVESSALGNAGAASRRLHGAEQAPQRELKRSFSTPEDAWRSLGFELGDRGAEFRRARPRGPAAEEILALVEEANGAAAAHSFRGPGKALWEKLDCA